MHAGTLALEDVNLADILIKNGYVITMDSRRRVLESGSVVIDDGKISAVGKDMKAKCETTIDARGKAVLPGLINAHTHLSMTLLRGVADDMPLMEWLEKKIWPIEENLTADDCYAGALLGSLEMIKSGTTCFADQYFYMEDVARAVEEAGPRAVLSRGIIELDDPEKRKRTIREGERLVKNCHGMANGRILTMFGPHAAYTCSTECLMQVKELARKYKVGIHTHIAETKEEVEMMEKKYGKHPVEHLDGIDFLGPEVLAAHCVWLTKQEIRIIKSNGVKPVHNPVSNMKTASGVAPVPEMMKAGIPVALGTDGAASNNSLDMFNEMKFAALLSKVHTLVPTVVPAQAVLEMATIKGGIALGLQRDIGSLEVGKKADIVLVDLKKPHLSPLHNVISHLVYSAVGSDVDTVIVDGEVLMQGRKVLTLDEDKVLEDVQKVSDDLLARGGFK
jgi:5-methylthioadenosine/S-adenosylhomocysteine deaminase